MDALLDLFEKNRRWTEHVLESDPAFFTRLALQQEPQFLWIGCADSRVPANEIVGLQPGELFVHRNVANLVVHTDLNCLSVMQYAVDVLRVRHIIVCGHYGCGGIHSALHDERHGLIDNWLRHVQDIRDYHLAVIDEAPDDRGRWNRLCEVNILEQVTNVCQSTVVLDAWDRGQYLAVHGWIYDIHDGLLRDLGVTVESAAELRPAYGAALERLRG